jgi:ATP-dependent DNA helicase RecG
MPSLRLANLVRDRELLESAKVEAQRFVASSDPEITPSERQQVIEHMKTHWQRRYGLVEVG